MSKTNKIKRYEFVHDDELATVVFDVDMDLVKEEIAREILAYYDLAPFDDEPAIDAMIKEMAVLAITFSASNKHNIYGVQKDFKDEEAWPLVDGSTGINLVKVQESIFDDLDESLKLVTEGGK